jgi:xanthine/CO dehydrogenase XdhC/CoxF family maturation factor
MKPVDEDLLVLRALVEGEASAECQVLATVVATRGSTPRKEGARMVIGPDGAVKAGTVGGGCGEGEVIEAAATTLADGKTRVVSIDLTKDLLTLSPAVCGGVMEVRVERVEYRDRPLPAWPGSIAAGRADPER